MYARTGLATIVNKGVPGQLLRTMADNLTANTQDQLHWNSAGGELVGNGYGDFLNQLK